MHDVVIVVESTGTAADLEHLPCSPMWQGSAMTPRLGDATSRAGGVMIGVHSRFSAHGVRTECEAIIIRRVLAVTFWHAAQVVAHIFGVHIDPALSDGQKLWVFRRIATAGGRYPEAVSAVGGDWNLTHRDEERLRIDGTERRDTYMEADRFDSAMRRFAEVSQPHYAFPLPSVTSGAFSMIDRWYVCVGGRGELQTTLLPITLTISARDARWGPASEVSCWRRQVGCVPGHFGPKA